MTRKTLHPSTPITTLIDWDDPLNPRDSLKMTLYWHDRKWKFPNQPTYQPPLYERSPRRLHAHIPVNDRRPVVNGPTRRWAQECAKRFEQEMAALRLYDIATGRAPLPDDINSS